MTAALACRAEETRSLGAARHERFVHPPHTPNLSRPGANTAGPLFQLLTRKEGTRPYASHRR